MDIMLVWLLALVAGAAVGVVLAMAGATDSVPVFGALIAGAVVRFALAP